MDRCALHREGRRFGLRPCEEADGDAVFAAAAESRERVARWMPWLTPGYGPEDSRVWGAGAAADWERGERYEFVIIDRSDRGVVGCCGLNNLNRENLVANLGYWVRESRIRLGAAREAVELLRRFGLETLGLTEGSGGRRASHSGSGRNQRRDPRRA